jgi:AGCS family alanine or glycine:cation symporter
MIVAIGVFLFGWSTSTGWYTYYETILRHLLKGNEKLQKNILTFYKYTFPIPEYFMIILATTTGLPSSILWLFADFTTAILHL